MRNQRKSFSKFVKHFLFICAIAFIILTFNFLRFPQNKISPELKISLFSPYENKGAKAVAASCGTVDAGHSAADYSACQLTINCCYGGPVTGLGTQLCGGTCTSSNPQNLPNINSPICPNSPNMGKPCTSAPNACGETGTGTYDACGICNATSPAVPTCIKSNVCNQIFTGYQCGSTCTAGNGISDINSSCISNFTVTSNTVNPNGSVDFSWSIPSINNVSSKCGFVDLTTPTPRPIPGLQNLDSNTDSVRITNIQATTRFCLVCQFYNLLDNSSLGQASVHQWVKVQRIGEN